MESFDLCLFATVSASSRGDGLVIEAKNISDEKLRVRFPNPYTGVRLYSETGDMVPIGRSILCWEESDPIVELSPRDSASALVLLYSFWFNLHGVFVARCPLNVSSCDGESGDGVVEGRVNLDLPSFRRSRASRSANGPQPPPRLLNVSDYVSIIGRDR